MRVLVADDDPLARRAIRALLREGGVTVVAEANDGDQAVAAARHHRPDVILLELGIPGLPATEVTARIVASCPEVRVVVIAAGADDAAALGVLRAGASGFVSKSGDVESLPRLLRGVARGEAAISPVLSMRLIEALRAVPTDGRGMRPVRSKLTNREWEVIDLLAAGSSTRDVAEELVLTPDTVYTHLKNIMRKLGVHTRGEAVEAALELRASSFARPPGDAIEVTEADIRALIGSAPGEIPAAA